MPISTYTDGVGDAFRSIGEYASGLVAPTVRLGVTGLARSGKTVFITALVHNLIASARLPFFNAAAEGRLVRAYLEPQPDDVVPRFDYETHLTDLTASPPRWPDSTRRISQLRLTLEYSSRKFWKRQLGRERLHIDIVDYPGEWLLDLPLLRIDYREWSRAALDAGRCARPQEGLQGLAEGACRDRSHGTSRRGARGEALCIVQGLSRRGAVGPIRAIDASPRPLPHAGRARRIAGAHLRPARSRRRDRFRAWLALVDDGAALRGLQDACGEAVLPRSFFAARPADRADRRARRPERRSRGGERSRARHDRDPRMLQDRRQHSLVEPVRAAHRPHRARRHQGRSSAPPEPRPARGDPRQAHGKSHGARGICRAPR